MSADENGSPANMAIHPFGLMTRRYSSHIGANGYALSHLHCVIPYGGSVRIISTLPSSISFIRSKHPPWRSVIPFVTVCLLCNQKGHRASDAPYPPMLPTEKPPRRAAVRGTMDEVGIWAAYVRTTHTNSIAGFSAKKRK